jgi:hypothetical protein
VSVTAAGAAGPSRTCCCLNSMERAQIDSLMLSFMHHASNEEGQLGTPSTPDLLRRVIRDVDLLWRLVPDLFCSDLLTLHTNGSTSSA